MSAILLFRITGFIRILVVARYWEQPIGKYVPDGKHHPEHHLRTITRRGLCRLCSFPLLFGCIERGAKPMPNTLQVQCWGILRVVLAGAVIIGVLLAPMISEAMFSGVSDLAVRLAESRSERYG